MLLSYGFMNQFNNLKLPHGDKKDRLKKLEENLLGRRILKNNFESIQCFEQRNFTQILG